MDCQIHLRILGILFLPIIRYMQRLADPPSCSKLLKNIILS